MSSTNSAKPLMVIGTDPAWLSVESGVNFVCASSDIVTPMAFIPPGPPTIKNATVGSHTITITLTAPASNGTAPLSSYNVTCASDLGTINTGEWPSVSCLVDAASSVASIHESPHYFSSSKPQSLPHSTARSLYTASSTVPTTPAPPWPLIPTARAMCPRSGLQI